MLYGCENLILNGGEMKDYAKIESNIVKRMFGIQKRCRTKSLFRAINLESTRDQVIKLKFSFYQRLRKNLFTSLLLDQLELANTKNSLNKEIDKLTNGMDGTHVNGDAFSMSDKIDLCIKVNVITANDLSAMDELVPSIKKVLKCKNKLSIATQLENLIHFTVANAEQA